MFGNRRNYERSIELKKKTRKENTFFFLFTITKNEQMIPNCGSTTTFELLTLLLL